MILPTQLQALNLVMTGDAKHFLVVALSSLQRHPTLTTFRTEEQYLSRRNLDLTPSWSSNFTLELGA